MPKPSRKRVVGAHAQGAGKGRRGGFRRRLWGRIKLGLEVIWGLIIATVLSAVAFLCFWFIEWLAKKLGVEGEAWLLKQLKVVATVATFIVYYAIDLRDLLKGGGDAD